MRTSSRPSKITCFFLLLLPLALVIYNFYSFYRMARYSHPILSTAQVQATASAARFGGEILLSTEIDGQHDVVVWYGSRYAGAVDPIATSTADETDPVWSPDYRWIAYLSDESGKVEVYARQYMGSRVVRLTHAEDIVWRGPLLWLGIKESAIVLAGTLRDGERQLYLIPTSGEDRTPRALDGTNGARAPRFFINYPPNFYSRKQGAAMLFFDRLDGHLFFYSLTSKRAQLVTQEDGPRGLEIMPGAVMPGWTNLVVYLTRGDPPDGEVGLELRSSAYGPIYGTPSPNNLGDELSGRATATGDASRAATVTPDSLWLTPDAPFDNRLILSSRLGVIAGFLAGNYSLLVAQDGPLDGSGISGCYRWYTYNLFEFPLRKDHSALFPDVCVDPPANGFHLDMISPAHLENHHYSAYWVVFSGRPAGGGPRGLYAAYIFSDPTLIKQAVVTRLKGSPNGVVAASSISVRQAEPGNYSYLPYGSYGPTPVVDP